MNSRGLKRQREELDEYAHQQAQTTDSNMWSFISNIPFIGKIFTPTKENNKASIATDATNSKRRRIDSAEVENVPGSFPDVDAMELDVPVVSTEYSRPSTGSRVVSGNAKTPESRNIWTPIALETKIRNMAAADPYPSMMRLGSGTSHLSKQAAYLSPKVPHSRIYTELSARKRYGHLADRSDVRRLLFHQSSTYSPRKSNLGQHGSPVHLMTGVQRKTPSPSDIKVPSWSAIQKDIQTNILEVESDLAELQRDDALYKVQQVFRLTTSEKLEKQRLKRARELAAKTEREAAARDAAAKKEAERKAKEDADRKVKEEAARKAKEDAQKKASAEKLLRNPPQKVMKDLAGWMVETDNLKEVTKIGRNPVNRGDLMTIIPGPTDRTPWANDNAMNAFLAALCTEASELYKKTRKSDPGFDDKIPRYHAFNTQWYPKMKKDGYDSIKNWALRAKIGGSKLMNCGRIIIPVFDANHWTLLVISPQRHLVQFYNSLGSHRIGGVYLREAAKFLRGELKDGFHEQKWTFIEETSGQQTNGCDCGIFACCNALATFYTDTLKDLVPDGEMQEARYFFAGVLANGGFKGDMAFDKLHSGFTLE